MPAINILSPHVADLIAAGEVVERPASVLKELIENSFDAGAKNITVEFRDGGMTYMRVQDDGCGMLPEDAGVCFLRHATSKLHDEAGLESIGTMGFRGEALAAVSSVSKIELLTRKKGEDVGTRMLVDAGDIAEMKPHGCPEGTTMIIRDLFHNTPARLKFMKSDKSEATACTAAALRCALGRPEVSLRLIKDGQEVFFSPGDGKISSAVYSLLGRDAAKELLECTSNDEGIEVSGFVSSPKFGHGNRARQFFFVNGRSIKSQMLTAAVEQAYKNTMLTGRFPACTVYLKIDPASLDVNVHPAKTEIKFRDERKVFDAVYYSALSAIQGERATAEIELSPSTQRLATAPKKDFYQSMSSSDYREKFVSAPKKAGTPIIPAAGASKPGVSVENRGTIVWDRTSSKSVAEVHEGLAPYGSRTVPDTPKTLELYPGAPVADGPSIQAQPVGSGEYVAVKGENAPCGEGTLNTPVQQEVIFEAFAPLTDSDGSFASPQSSGQQVLSDTTSDFRLVGETMNTYILVEKDDALILIDKHAAHERMIFDRLKSQGREIMSQALLIPVTLKLTAEDVELIEQNEKLLSSLGFEIDPYGEDTVILRCVPADTDAADAAAMVEEICETLHKGDLSASNYLDEILHTIACKAAIKAGWRTTDAELSEIARAVISGQVKYCPHGRPVSFTLTHKQLDKEFSRIV